MREPNDLIRTDALARDLGHRLLRVYDCTTYLEPTPPGSDDPYIAVPGRSSFEAAHIPGCSTSSECAPSQTKSALIFWSTWRTLRGL